ncbi:unnamed protein product [Microthlaspi erraticum]|uniref:Uncharacterized protein n=1 Tax=Microthlaspi erraticum TaxID=1685480 RepID=A0A6D2JW05_9BRAS|nr:unnamed protein product [Microthlaspi erraticum]
MVRKFLQGLKPEIGGRLQALTYTHLYEVIEKAVNVETFVAKEQAVMSKPRENRNQGGSNSKIAQQSKKGNMFDLKVVVLHWWWNNPLSLLVAVWSISLTNRSSLPSSTESITQRVSIPLWYVHCISNKHLRFLLYPL